jgi:hypothetical protein
LVSTCFSFLIYINKVKAGVSNYEANQKDLPNLFDSVPFFNQY